MSKGTIAIDFDGVINSYTSGWKGADVLPDPPVSGAVEFIRKAWRLGYNVVVYSSRAETRKGRDAIVAYLDKAFTEIPDPLKFYGLMVTDRKPKAKLYIDDRGFRFEGVFPDLETLDLRPWNKKEKRT